MRLSVIANRLTIAMLATFLAATGSPAGSAAPTSFHCPAVEAMPAAMGIRTRYAGPSVDPTFSTLDNAKVEQQRPVRAKFDRPVTRINMLAYRYAQTRDANERTLVADCLARHLASLPASRAMTEAESDADQYYRDWMVSSLAISWLRAQPTLDTDPRANAIKGWFADMARQIRTYHDARRVARAGLDNHAYWAAAAVAGSARVTGNAGDLAWSSTLLTDALAGVDSEGIFAAEIARGPRATHYHLFAAVPLAAIAILTGTESATIGDGAFKRLAERIASDIGDPSGGRIAKLTRQPQGPVQRGQLTLIAAIIRQDGYQDSALADRLDALAAGHRAHSYFLGGDLDFLIAMAGVHSAR